MMSAIAAIMAMSPSAQQMELAKLAPYKSRGKGKGHNANGRAAKALHFGRSKYKPHEGAREVSRRQSQIARGILKASA